MHNPYRLVCGVICFLNYFLKHLFAQNDAVFIKEFTQTDVKIHFIWPWLDVFWFSAQPVFEWPYLGFAIFDRSDLLQKYEKTLKPYLKHFMFFKTHVLVWKSENHQRSYPQWSQKGDFETGVGAFGRSWNTFGATAPFLIAKHAAKGSKKWPQEWESRPKRCPKVGKMWTTCPRLWRNFKRKQRHLPGPGGLREAVSEPRPGGLREALTIKWKEEANKDFCMNAHFLFRWFFEELPSADTGVFRVCMYWHGCFPCLNVPPSSRSAHTKAYG